VTSPPYWGLRDYGGDSVEWGPVIFTPQSGIPSIEVPAWEGALGLEPTLEMYVGHLVEIFRAVHPLLRDDGTMWVNLGDSYVGGGGYFPGAPSNHPDAVAARSFGGHSAGAKRGGVLVASGLKPKDLAGVPWRVAHALQADGWWLRSDVIWSKPNPFPDAARDRPTKAHEHVFQFAKSYKYFFNQEAVREKAVTSGTRNIRSVWRINTQPCRGAHFAVMAIDVADKCVKAGTSVGGSCGKCRAPLRPILEKELGRVTDYRPTCTCGVPHRRRCIVLDPFAGTGTTGVAAYNNAATFIGIDLLGGDYNLGGYTANQRIQAARNGGTLALYKNGIRPLFDRHTEFRDG